MSILALKITFGGANAGSLWPGSAKHPAKFVCEWESGSAKGVRVNIVKMVDNVLHRKDIATVLIGMLFNYICILPKHTLI